MAREPVVDIHAHFVPEGYLRLIETEGQAHGLHLRAGPDGPFIMIGRVPIGPITSAYHDLDRRLQAMDAQGVTIHALSLMPPMVYWADAALGQRLARLVNDVMAEAVRAHPDRLVGLATLPLQAPEAAVVEVERAVTELGLRGVYLGTNVRGTDLDDPTLLPVFARIAALGVPVFLHPLNVLGGGRVGAYYLHNLLGNPFDTAVAAARLVFGGVLDRFPSLRVCLPHAGGAFPYLVGRLDRGYRVRAECRHLPRPPSAYLERFCFDTITHSPDALRYLIGLVGAERVMLGSDYCFDMGYEDPVGALKAVEPLSPDDRARILGGNALRLLRLE
ncbi:MAG: amidohydrolase [Candidatus Rokubacteria bacterium]|nr:amidohydrolase [Candidatus Rokubacteria bacterium]